MLLEKQFAKVTTQILKWQRLPQKHRIKHFEDIFFNRTKASYRFSMDRISNLAKDTDGFEMEINVTWQTQSYWPYGRGFRSAWRRRRYMMRNFVLIALSNKFYYFIKHSFKDSVFDSCFTCHYTLRLLLIYLLVSSIDKILLISELLVWTPSPLYNIYMKVETLAISSSLF